MLIDSDEINEVLRETPSEVVARGKRYFEQDKVEVSEVNIENDSNYNIIAKVRGNSIYKVKMKKENTEIEYNCNCPSYDLYGGVCKHVIATFFDIYINNEKYEKFENQTIASIPEFLKKKIANDDKIIAYYESQEINQDLKKEDIEIIPILNLLYKDLDLKFKIGKKKKYILKDLAEFGATFFHENEISYGKDLSFVNAEYNYADNSKKIAKFISKKSQEYNEYARLGNYYFSLERRYKGKFSLRYSILDEFFDIAIENYEYVQIEDYSYIYPVIDLKIEDPKLNFKVEETKDTMKISHNFDDYYLFYGQEYVYILYDGTLYRCTHEFKKNILPFVKEFYEKRKPFVEITKQRATSFCEYVLPKLKVKTEVRIDQEIVEKYKAEKLGTKLFLDIDEKNNIIAEVKFLYGDIEFNPFAENQKVDANRNIIKENKVKEILDSYKFKLDLNNKNLILEKEEDIYNFLNEGIHTFMEKFEVLVTDKLKNRKIMNPKAVAMGVRIDNNLLEIDIADLGFDKDELSSILKTYRLKKKYHRLKDGSFLNLESSAFDSIINMSNDLNISEKELLSGNVKLPKYRAIYFNSLINDDENIIINKDKEFKNIIRDITDIENIDFEEPAIVKKILREYQKTGFNWLKTLDKYGFGGILADDMGLGKTLQVITLLIDEKENSHKTSIVVCPSSLYINWEKEINKFAPKIKTLVISGGVEEREIKINKCNKFDVVITSYDLLKRDIEKYKNMEFRYIIADEAQYVKNNNTKNSKALKSLKGNTRFALTGTPMENSLSELWSIFDFVMPGYLYNYKKFKEDFETSIIKDDDKMAMARLHKLVKPFILRRVKKEVLKELPDKTETAMYTKMDEEQDKVYKAYLAKAKDELKTELIANSFENSQIKILALITRLRQICCHPSLFLENYTGTSSKLDQCMEIVESAVESNHKILIFSQFTSMIEILQKELNKKDIKYFTLTGKTKVDIRVEMVDDFNKNKDINVFLISLKAGGTGLNLTGADMVIHFDPWWNLSVQNQATDRAYRIGQRNNVQVFKLITENTIEEKIEKLQIKKMDLTNQVITEGETFITKMGKDEILDLFK